MSFHKKSIDQLFNIIISKNAKLGQIHTSGCRFCDEKIPENSSSLSEDISLSNVSTTGLMSPLMLELPSDTPDGKLKFVCHTSGTEDVVVTGGIFPDVNLIEGFGALFIFEKGIGWCILSDSTSVSLVSEGGTETLVVDGMGPTLSTKGLTAGTAISLTGAPSDVTITNTSPATDVTLVSVGAGETLVNDGSGPSLANKSLTAGTGISLSSDGTSVTITNSSPVTGIGGLINGYSYKAVAAGPVVVLEADTIIDVSHPGGNTVLVVNLPTIGGLTEAKQVYVITDANGATSGTDIIRVTATGGDTINGAASVDIIVPYTSLTLYSDTVSEWHLM